MLPISLFLTFLLLFTQSSSFVYRSSLIKGYKSSRLNMLINPFDLMDPSSHHLNDMNLLLISAEEAVSVYSKVDKTGFIGFLATYVELAIDLGHNIFGSLGLKNNYGYSIIVFTFLIKLLTLPLTTKQLESTTKMQQLTPFQQKIQKLYANDEQTKNQLLAQLFQAANVNPLAGCLPALVQIPIFISLYRALQNLVAENKLSESFLWIPDLEGPVYTNPPSTAMDWIKSAFTGNPSLGWPDTLAFLSLPLILYISQTISQKVLQPPKDPNKVLTEQEEISQGIINNLPFIVAFFSINVPAGLAVYWIVNNILTTAITAAVKSQFAKEPVPIEVTRMMAAIEAGLMNSGGTSNMRMKPRGSSNAMNELRGQLGESDSTLQTRSSSGFGKNDFIDATFEAAAAATSSTTTNKDLDENTTTDGGISDKSDISSEESSVNSNQDSGKKRSSRKAKADKRRK